MKKALITAVMMVMVLAVSMQAEAALQNLGVDSEGNRLIYDTDLNITWYDHTTPSYESWQDQMDWADALSVSFGVNTYTDWRLPTALNQDGSGPCSGYNCTGSEIGHLYYTELGNVAYGGLANVDEFQNLQDTAYWLSTEDSAITGNAWRFYAAVGNQYSTDNTGLNYAVAVRDGLAVVSEPPVVPEPISSTLFLIGGATLGFRRMRKIKS